MSCSSSTQQVTGNRGLEYWLVRTIDCRKRTMTTASSEKTKKETTEKKQKTKNKKSKKEKKSYFTTCYLHHVF